MGQHTEPCISDLCSFCFAPDGDLPAHGGATSESSRTPSLTETRILPLGQSVPKYMETPTVKNRRPGGSRHNRVKRLSNPQNVNEEPSSPSTSSSSAESSLMDLRVNHRNRSRHDSCVPTEREDGKQKHQRPAERERSVDDCSMGLQQKRGGRLDRRSTGKTRSKRWRSY